MEYILISRLKLNSKIHGGKFYRFTFIQVENEGLYEATVDQNFRNYSKWRELITSDEPWGIYTNIHPTTTRITNRGTFVANADYKPELVYKLNINEVRQLEKMLRKDKIL